MKESDYYHPQFVSENKKVEIRLLVPQGNILCYCRQCGQFWRRARYAVLVITKHALYSDCPWFYGKDDYPMPINGKIRWITTFGYVGTKETFTQYCRKTEDCQQHNEGSTPVYSNLKNAQKLIKNILKSEDFRAKGEISIGTPLCITSWRGRWPKMEKLSGTLKIIG